MSLINKVLMDLDQYDLSRADAEVALLQAHIQRVEPRPSPWKRRFVTVLAVLGLVFTLLAGGGLMVLGWNAGTFPDAFWPGSASGPAGSTSPAQATTAAAPVIAPAAPSADSSAAPAAVSPVLPSALPAAAQAGDLALASVASPVAAPAPVTRLAGTAALPPAGPAGTASMSGLVSQGRVQKPVQAPTPNQIPNQPPIQSASPPPATAARSAPGPSLSKPGPWSAPVAPVQAPVAVGQPSFSASPPVSGPASREPAPRPAEAVEVRGQKDYEDALSLLRQQRPAEAEALLRSLTVLEPQHVGARVALARLLVTTRRASASVELLADGLKRLPGNVQLMLVLGESHQSLGQEREALDIYQQVLRVKTLKAEHRLIAEERVRLLSGQLVR